MKRRHRMWGSIQLCRGDEARTDTIKKHFRSHCGSSEKFIQSYFSGSESGEHQYAGEFRDKQNWIGPSGSLLKDALFVSPPDAISCASRDRPCTV